jgi:hypothetical protein
MTTYKEPNKEFLAPCTLDCFAGRSVATNRYGRALKGFLEHGCGGGLRAGAEGNWPKKLIKTVFFVDA